MTSRLIGLGLSDHPSSPVRAKVECCKSHDLFGCQIKDCSATRTPSLSITGHYPRLTGSLIGGGFTPLQRCSRRILEPRRARRREERKDGGGKKERREEGKRKRGMMEKGREKRKRREEGWRREEREKKREVKRERREERRVRDERKDRGRKREKEGKMAEGREWKLEEGREKIKMSLLLTIFGCRKTNFYLVKSVKLLPQNNFTLFLTECSMNIA